MSPKGFDVRFESLIGRRHFVFNVDNGRIAAMDLGADADTTDPSAAFAHRSCLAIHIGP